MAIAHAGVGRGSSVLRTLALGLVVAMAGASALAGLEAVDTTVSLTAPVVYVVGAALLFWRRRSGSRFGAANTVTLTRLIGTSWLVALATAAAVAGLGRPGQIVVVVIGGSCLLLDSIDGRLARNRGEASQFGARFDMEIDAAMLLVLSVGVAVLGLAGWWVVGIGLMRYANALASWLLPPLRTRVFYSFARKVVAAIQGVALLFALLAGVVPAIPHWLSTTVLAMALALLCWSFGRDIVWQLTIGRRAGGPQWGLPTR